MMRIIIIIMSTGAVTVIITAITSISVIGMAVVK